MIPRLGPMGPMGTMGPMVPKRSNGSLVSHGTPWDPWDPVGPRGSCEPLVPHGSQRVDGFQFEDNFSVILLVPQRPLDVLESLAWLDILRIWSSLENIPVTASYIYADAER